MQVTKRYDGTTDLRLSRDTVTKYLRSRGRYANIFRLWTQIFRRRRVKWRRRSMCRPWTLKRDGQPSPGAAGLATTNYYIDTETSLILDVEASPARFGAEVGTTSVMVRRTHERLGVKPERLAADAAYGSARLLNWLLDEGLEPHIPVMDRRDQTQGKLSRKAFAYDPASDSFTCPEGRRLTYRGMDRSAGSHAYYARPADCAVCPSKAVCTAGPA